MPRNGAGTASLSSAPFVFDTVISETPMNANFADIINMLTASIANDGQTPILANLQMSGYRHTGVNVTSGTSSRTEYASTGTMQDGVPLDAGYTGGTDTAYTATLTPAIAAYADKQCFRVIFDQACGATPTINFNTVGAKKMYRSVAGVATQVTTGDIPANFPTDLRYDSTLDTSAGGFWVMDSSGVSAGSIGTEELSAATIGMPTNLTLAASVAANALTIALKTQAGADPSSSDPVKVPFPNQTGGYDVLSVTAATSLVVPDTATLGTANAVLAKLWVVAFNDSSTFRLGILNTQEASGITNLVPYNTYSSTTIGTGSDSAGVIYSGTGVTTKAIQILGFLEVTEATAGTWATAPSKVVVFKPWMPLPGARLPARTLLKTDTFSTTSTSFTDVTGSSLNITLSSAANRVLVELSGTMGKSDGNSAFLNILRGSTVIAQGDAASSRVRCTMWQNLASGGAATIGFSYLDAPGSVSAQTYKLQMRVGSSGGTAYLNTGVTDADSGNIGRAATALTLTEINA